MSSWTVELVEQNVEISEYMIIAVCADGEERKIYKIPGVILDPTKETPMEMRDRIKGLLRVKHNVGKTRRKAMEGIAEGLKNSIAQELNKDEDLLAP